MGLANQVAIIGTRTIRFGKSFDQSYTNKVYEAAAQAMADAGVERRQLQAGGLCTDEPFLPELGARTGPAHTLGGPRAVSCVAVRGQP